MSEQPRIRAYPKEYSFKRYAAMKTTVASDFWSLYGLPVSSPRLTILEFSYEIGEVYLFHPTEMLCPADTSLWGLFDRRIGGRIYLESSSFDLCHFRLWHRLPPSYRYSRRASRSELSDYLFHLAYYECRRHRGPGPDLPYAPQTASCTRL